MKRSIARMEDMIERRDMIIRLLKIENKQLRQFIRDLEKKNAYLELLSQRRS